MSGERAKFVLRWKRKADDEPTTDLTQRGQFISEQVDLVEALVREAFQNILDAKDPDATSPIHVRIATKKGDVTGPTFQGGILHGLKEHLKACGMTITEGQLTHPGYLVIEDFQTTGLHGSWNSTGHGGWNDFFRTFGASNKGGRAGGRWGLGKLVFTSASAIRTFFALTIRSDDVPRVPLLMGQTVIKTHNIGGASYGPYGFFCLPGADGSIQLPVADQDQIASFVKEVGVTRTIEPGLSIVVVAPIENVSAREIVTFLLGNYFFPILGGELTVDIDGTMVSATTFDSLIQSHGSSSMKGDRLAAFIREIKDRRALPHDAIAPLNWPSSREMGFPSSKIEQLQKLYAAGKLLFVSFLILLRTKDGDDQPTYVEVFLRQTLQDENATTVVVRGLLTLPGEARRLKVAGCMAALIAEDDPVTSFLGDAEGPAHIDWNARAERVEKQWQNASVRLGEIRKAIRELHKLLAPSQNRRDNHAFRDEFSVTRSDGKPDLHPSRNGNTHRPSPSGLISSKRKFLIRKRPGGFVISAAPGLIADDLPMKIRVRVAFDVPRGNPFKQHHRFDFDLTQKDISTRSTDAKIEPVNAHTALITATGVGFRATFEGFDTNRDLVVDPRRSIES